MELSDVECVEFLYASLWKDPGQGAGHSEQQDEKTKAANHVHATILDTVLFREGKPFKWLFTSDKTGQVMRKRTDRLNNTADMIKQFTARGRTIRGMKAGPVKDKIATVFFVDGDGQFCSRLVSEGEMGTVLANKSNEEIIAVQVFIGGWPLNGNGFFEHRYALRGAKGQTYQETYEMVNRPSDEKWGNVATFYDMDADRLIVQGVHHSSLKQCAQCFVQCMQKVSRTPVAEVIFQFHFNSSWVPICSGIKGLVLLDAPVEVFQFSDNPFESIARTNMGASNKFDRLEEKASDHPFSGGDTVTLSRVQSAPNKLHNEQAAERGDQAGMGLGAEHSLLSSSAAAAREREASGPTNLQQTNESNRKASVTFLMQNIANDKSEVVATRRPKPKAFSKDAADEKRFSETTNHPLGRSLARERNFLATTGMTNTRYQMETETSKVKQNFYRDSVKGVDWQFAAHEDEWSSEIRKRRPLSAPATGKNARPASASAARQAGSSGLGEGVGARPKSAVGTSGVRPGGHGLLQGGHRASGLEKPLSMGGTTCFGEFCEFTQALGANEGVKVSVKGHMVLRAKDCDKRVSYKSLLLPRAEAKFLGCELTDGGPEVKQLLQEHADDDQVRAYFVKKRLNAVVQRCKQDSYKIIFTTLKQDKHALWDGLNFVYRKMVYAEALTGMHPSRFYYTVPVCGCCHRVYSLMDIARSRALVKMPDKHEVDAAEKASMSMNAKKDIRDRWRKQTEVERIISVSQEYEHGALMFKKVAGREGGDSPRDTAGTGDDRPRDTAGAGGEPASRKGRKSDFDFNEDEVNQRYDDSIDEIERRLEKKTFHSSPKKGARGPTDDRHGVDTHTDDRRGVGTHHDGEFHLQDPLYMAGGVDVRFPDDPVFADRGDSPEGGDGTPGSPHHRSGNSSDGRSSKESFKNRFMLRIERAKADAAVPSKTRSSVVAVGGGAGESHRKMMEEAVIRRRRASVARREGAGAGAGAGGRGGHDTFKEDEDEDEDEEQQGQEGEYEEEEEEFNFGGVYEDDGDEYVSGEEWDMSDGGAGVAQGQRQGQTQRPQTHDGSHNRRRGGGGTRPSTGGAPDRDRDRRSRISSSGRSRSPDTRDLRDPHRQSHGQGRSKSAKRDAYRTNSGQWGSKTVGQHSRQAKGVGGGKGRRHDNKGWGEHRVRQRNAHDALTERYRRVTGQEPHNPQPKEKRLLRVAHRHHDDYYNEDEDLPVDRETRAQSARRQQREEKEEKRHRAEQREERRRRQTPSGLGGPAPTFEFSYTRAVAKLREDRVRQDSALRRSVEDEAERQEKEYFRVSTGFNGLHDAYRDNRDPREISKRDPKQKRRRRAAANPGLRPRSAGVLLPQNGRGGFPASDKAHPASFTSAAMMSEAAERAGIAVGRAPAQGGKSAKHGTAVSASGAGAMGVMGENDNQHVGNGATAPLVGAPATVSAASLTSAPSPGGMSVATDMAVAPTTTSHTLSVGGGGGAGGGGLGPSTAFAYASLPFMPAPFLPMGSPGVDTSKPFLSAAYHRAPSAQQQRRPLSPQRSASENFVTSVLRPFQDLGGALPFAREPAQKQQQAQQSHTSSSSPGGHSTRQEAPMVRLSENVALF